MQIEVTCNTDDAVLLEHIQQNSRLPLRWVKSIPAHDGHAVIVGGGPSVIDYLPSIKARIDHGQTVFALNGACRFLNSRGVKPDYQVIMDARAENIGLLGDAHAYLLASQCHPSLFAAVPNATLWHTVDEDETPIPDEQYDDGYALIGGGTVVGLSSMCLAYTMGYRKLHLYGYDSSRREDALHAYDQKLTPSEAIPAKVTLGGKTFSSTLAMAAQAERFPEVCNNLIDAGCEITVDADGLIMAVVEEMRKTAEPITEVEKYRQMWSLPAYRDHSPGEQFAEEFVILAGIDLTHTVIDFGCGTGRGGQKIADLRGCNVLLTDLADNCLDNDIPLPFTTSDFSKPIDLRGDVGYCTDVMEHIPPKDVPGVIENIMACVDRCFFKIALFPDNMGSLIGHPLHLSVFPAEWWKARFQAYRILYEAAETDTAFPYATFFVQKG